ncbi:hypothetical protein [Psychroserpens algicola]|uniref:Uncharacterized protein n=1 Tax=Psychroserpens algicola TaxID=1719034 RepID=A0ABT0H3U9_9FLAO|nr:hypothetical protein [Psychroserpens algicola]MCK8479051.1 hypothetical protein [Psychroserpens algicola]
MKTKGSAFVSAIKYLLKGLWKLLLLCLYAVAKIVEVLSGFVAKMTDKFLT